MTGGFPLHNVNVKLSHTVYPKKYAHGFCFAVLCCGYTLTDFPISIRLTSLALWPSNNRPSASKATLMNMDKYFMWIHYERLHNHNKAKHNKTVYIFLGIYCIISSWKSTYINGKHVSISWWAVIGNMVHFEYNWNKVHPITVDCYSHNRTTSFHIYIKCSQLMNSVITLQCINVAELISSEWKL